MKNDELYNKAKAFIKKDICMKFYNEKEPLYLGRDMCGVDHLQKRCSNTPIVT